MQWTSARQAARTSAKPLEAVETPLASAVGAVLAAPLRALIAAPSFANSAMDGYAVAGPGPWLLTGRVPAGAQAGVLHPGEAVEIATGAPVPTGTDAILPVEAASLTRAAPPPPGMLAAGKVASTTRDEATPQAGLAASDEHAQHSPAAAHAKAPGEGGPRAGRTAGSILVSGEVEPGRHIRRVGESCPAGELLLPAGVRVSPAGLGLAAGVGHDTLLVHRPPAVAVVLTGDEVVPHGLPGPGRVRDAIGPVLPGLVAAAGARLAGATFLADFPGALTEALREVDTDVVVVCGATSVGPADHLRRALESLNADVRVDGVAVRPGHPQVLAALPDGRFVVGLPGNPFAALSATVTLLVPLLESLAGREPEPPKHANLGFKGHERDTRLVPVVVSGDVAIPVGHDQPGTLWGAALADALAVVPPGFRSGAVELLALE